jgi:hypothetical protein
VSWLQPVNDRFEGMGITDRRIRNGAYPPRPWKNASCDADDALSFSAVTVETPVYRLARAALSEAISF